MFQTFILYSYALGSLKWRCGSSPTNFNYEGQEHTVTQRGNALANKGVEKNLVSQIITKYKITTFSY